MSGTRTKSVEDSLRDAGDPRARLPPVLSVLAGVYLMLNLPLDTWARFLGWMLLGVLVYAVYGRSRSRLATPAGRART